MHLEISFIKPYFFKFSRFRKKEQNIKVEKKMINIARFWEICLSWFQKRTLEIERFFFVTFAVLDMPKGRLLRIVRIIAELIMVHAVLKLVRKRFMFQVHQYCQRKNRYFPGMRYSLLTAEHVPQNSFP